MDEIPDPVVPCLGGEALKRDASGIFRRHQRPPNQDFPVLLPDIFLAEVERWVAQSLQRVLVGLHLGQCLGSLRLASFALFFLHVQLVQIVTFAGPR